MRVIVYKNLKRGDWSIAAITGRDGTGRGKVIDRLSSVTLANVRFHIQDLGRSAYAGTRTREVHAWAIGDIVEFGTLWHEGP